MLLLTGVQQVGVLVSQNLVGQEVVSVSVEGEERHHVVAIVVANGSVGSWVAGSWRLVGPEPALVDTEKNSKTSKTTEYECIFYFSHLTAIHPQKLCFPHVA